MSNGENTPRKDASQAARRWVFVVLLLLAAISVFIVMPRLLMHHEPHPEPPAHSRFGWSAKP